MIPVCIVVYLIIGFVVTGAYIARWEPDTSVTAYEYLFTSVIWLVFVLFLIAEACRFNFSSDITPILRKVFGKRVEG